MFAFSHHQSTQSLATFENNNTASTNSTLEADSGTLPNAEVAKLKRELEMSQDIIASLQKQLDSNVSRHQQKFIQELGKGAKQIHEFLSYSVMNVIG